MQQVPIGILKDNVNFVILLIMNHFFEFNQEDALVEPLQGGDLGHIEAVVPRGVLPLHLLNGHELLVVVVDALDNRTVSAFTQFFYKLILLHCYIKNN